MQDLRPLIDPLVELAIELLLKQAARRLPRAMQTARRRISSPRLTPFAVKQTRFIDHEAELRAIQAALADAPNSRVLFFSGPGGAGKTRLLQEAGRLADRYGRSAGTRWGGVLDLYHSDFHSVPALQMAIAQSLDPDGRYFENYRLQRQRFERRRAQGLVGRGFDAEMRSLEQVFLSDYDAFASDHRPVLAFDTVENLSYETDFIQTICDVGATANAARDWLLHRAGNLPNTVLLLAARPEPAMLRDLQRSYGSEPGRVEVVDVTGLTRADSHRLLKLQSRSARRATAALEGEFDRLWQVTQGLPVQIALAIELLVQGQLLDLVDLQESSDADAWKRRVVQQLFRYDEAQTRPFFFLGIARQGMTVDLLRYLAPEWSPEECQQHLAEAQRLFVVKARPDTSEIFLHDALYELYDVYAPEDPNLPLWYRRIATYYQVQQEQQAGNRLAWRNATVKRLYYLLQDDAQRAFLNHYRRWSESAIKGYEVTLDMQLRNVLLRHLARASRTHRSTLSSLNRTEVELDGAIRWVKRLLARSRNEQAADLAATILWLGPEPYGELGAIRSVADFIHLDLHWQEARDLLRQADTIFWGVLLTYYGEALAYLGPIGTKASDILDKAIALLNDGGNTGNDADAWLQYRALGRAYNTQGYVAWLDGHFGVALQVFRRALPFFKDFGVADEEADTLNNLAYLLGVLGEHDDALVSVNRALDLRLNLGYRYPIALSYNTRGLILGLCGQMEWGIRDCTLALSLFEETEESRGIGLACNALGFLLRHQACGIHPKEATKAIGVFSQAAAFLERAAHIFGAEIAEPVRLWEANNELGSLHRDWAHLALRCEVDERAHKSFKDAERYQRKALEVAREHGLRYQEADTRDDLAKLLADQRRFAEAENELSYIEQHLVADEYKLIRGQGFDVGQQPGETAWLVQGKVHLKRGLWSLRRLKSSEAPADRRETELDQAIEHFALGAAYFQQFWPTSVVLEQAMAAMTAELAAYPVPGHRIATVFQDASESYCVELQAIAMRIVAKLDF